jgi:hypothetical protein
MKNIIKDKLWTEEEKKNMDSERKNSKSGNEALELTITAFLILFFFIITAGVIKLDDKDPTLGVILIICAVISLGLTILVCYKPLISMIIGLIVYCISTGWFIASFHEDVFETKKSIKILMPISLGFILLIMALQSSLKNKNQ